MDIKTKYMNLELNSPIVVSSCPLSKKIENIEKMAAAGAGAVVLFSLFEEEIQHDEDFVDYFMEYGIESFAEATTYFPKLEDEKGFDEHYLELIQKATKVVDIPIIASLNATSDKGWVNYAKNIEQAGAHGIELNIFQLPTEINLNAEELEKRYITITKNVKEMVNIPIAVKLHPFFTSVPHIAKQLCNAGAKGLVLFNRFYQPDIDIDKMESESTLKLSTEYEMRLSLRWLALLYKQFNCSLASSTGIHSGADVIKAILTGADICTCASVLLENGIEYIHTMLNDVRAWMEQKEYQTIDAFKGIMSYQSLTNPAAFERANYMKAFEEFEK